jgi:hypothetical protein
MRKYIGIVLVMVAVVIAGFLVHAQVQTPDSPRGLQGPQTPQRALTVISGADIGFRVERWEGDTPVGRWVVRSDGKWVEPRTTMGTRRLTSH